MTLTITDKYSVPLQSGDHVVLQDEVYTLYEKRGVTSVTMKLKDRFGVERTITPKRLSMIEKASQEALDSFYKAFPKIPQKLIKKYKSLSKSKIINICVGQSASMKVWFTYDVWDDDLYITNTKVQAGPLLQIISKELDICLVDLVYTLNDCICCYNQVAKSSFYIQLTKERKQLIKDIMQWQKTVGVHEDYFYNTVS